MDFEGYKKRIIQNFKDGVRYFLTNKGYKPGDTNFGKQSNIRFVDYEQYEYQYLINEINNILLDSIKYNSRNFKRRDIIIK